MANLISGSRRVSTVARNGAPLCEGDDHTLVLAVLLKRIGLAVFIEMFGSVS